MYAIGKYKKGKFVIGSHKKRALIYSSKKYSKIIKDTYYPNSEVVKLDVQALTKEN